MADTKIEWATKVWNPVTGCSKISAGCRSCYAEMMAKRFWKDRKFTDIRCHPERLEQLLHWRKSQRIFVNSMSDLFHEDVPFGFVMQCLRIMAMTFQHTYIILTKRPKRMREFWSMWDDLSGEDFVPKLVRGPEATRKAHPSGRGKLFADMLENMGEPPPGCAYPTFDWMDGMITWPNKFENIWLGVSVEDQLTADERIPPLLQTPAAIRLVSIEPALGAIDISYPLNGCPERDEYHEWKQTAPPLDWVLCGGESGANARPCHPDWVRSLRDQCQAAGVPFFFKQWGEWISQDQIIDSIEQNRIDNLPNRKIDAFHTVYHVGKKRAGHMLDGTEWREFPKR